MWTRVFFLAGGTLLTACSAPTEASEPAAVTVEPRAEATPSVPVPKPAPPNAAIEDALTRVLPALSDRSMAALLRRPLEEASRHLAAGQQSAARRVLDRARSRLNSLTDDPDLTAVVLAIESGMSSGRR